MARDTEPIDVDTSIRLLEEAEAGGQEWDDLVKLAQSRLRTGFNAGEVDAKTAAQIVLADMRLREKANPPVNTDDLELLKSQVANVFGIDRGGVAKRDQKQDRKQTGRKR